MNTRIDARAVATGCVLLLLAGCRALGIEPPEAPRSVTRAVGDAFVVAQFQAPGGGAGVSGEARVIDVPTMDNSVVQVTVHGLTPGQHAWHIHSGSCASPGAVVVPFTAIGQMQALDKPLEVEADGDGAAEATIPQNLLSRQQIEAGDYALNIHATATGGAPVACATL